MLVVWAYSSGMDDNKILKIVYTFFLGIIIALFVGLGISTFYSAPTSPTYPDSVLQSGELTSEQSAVMDKDRRKYEQANREYTEKSQSYNRNVSIIALASAVVLVAVSLVFEKSNRVIGSGIMLGGLFTLLYSLGRGLASEDTKYTFIAATVGLLVALYLGYRRFSHDDSKPPAKLVSKRRSTAHN